jgi:hypothetical protein
VGLPLFADGKLSYSLMPAVGQAVILYGKTLLLLPAKSESTAPGAAR